MTVISLIIGIFTFMLDGLIGTSFNELGLAAPGAKSGSAPQEIGCITTNENIALIARFAIYGSSQITPVKGNVGENGYLFSSHPNFCCLLYNTACQRMQTFSCVLDIRAL